MKGKKTNRKHADESCSLVQITGFREKTPKSLFLFILIADSF